jgi:RiboL-PSP-HEPN
MQDAQSLFEDLKSHLDGLEEKFIKTFLGVSTADPNDYDLFVRAYCVLSHAALEEYLEGVALYVMQRSVEDFIFRREVKDTLLTLTAYLGLKLEVDENESVDETKAFDKLRTLLEDAKTKFSRSVHRNQGISVKYLRKLLCPVAVDIKQDTNLKNSLMQLAKERGTFAHQRAARKVISPEDAKNFVGDCLELCKDIKEKTNQKFA